MKKYYNKVIPTEIHFIYGGRHSGKTYYEFNKIKKENIKLKSKIDKAIEYIEKSINNPQPFYEYIIGDENGNVQNLDKLLKILKGEENE